MTFMLGTDLEVDFQQFTNPKTYWNALTLNRKCVVSSLSLFGATWRPTACDRRNNFICEIGLCYTVCQIVIGQTLFTLTGLLKQVPVCVNCIMTQIIYNFIVLSYYVILFSHFDTLQQVVA